jgi:hypothetical protein
VISTKKHQSRTKRKAKTTAALGPIAIAHDISWVTKQIAIGSCIGDAAKMAEASRQGITHILNLSRFDNTKLAKLHGIRISGTTSPTTWRQSHQKFSGAA